jgi:RHS repeat-associated protein
VGAGVVSLSLYMPWGESRGGAGTTLMDYGFTGQRSMEGSIGLQYFNARWYDSYITQFSQPDSIIPDLYNPLDWNRYAYVRYNPIVNTDPSGHRVVCDAEEDCDEAQKLSRLDDEGYWKELIKYDFGIKMSDKGDKKWDVRNLQLIQSSLSMVNNVLNGFLKSMVVGQSFVLMNQNPAEGDYHGCTMCFPGQSIQFFTKGTDALRQINIFHEVGHLLNSVPGFDDKFSSQITNPSWVHLEPTEKNGLQPVINPDALRVLRVQDPNYGTVGARQTFNNWGPREEWADAFANYVAGNIDMTSSEGQDMAGFVSGVLGH